MIEDYFVHRPQLDIEIQFRENQVYNIRGKYYRVVSSDETTGQVYFSNIKIDDTTNTENESVFSFDELDIDIWNGFWLIGIWTPEYGVTHINPIDLKHVIPN